MSGACAFLHRRGNSVMVRLAWILNVASVLFAVSTNAGAQRTENVAHIGLLCATRCQGHPAIEALRAGLRSAGWVEGSNLQIEYRAAEGKSDRLPALAQELVDLKLNLIVTSAPQASLAAKNATSTIPIVFIGVADPVRVKLVESLGRPGGNVTGLATMVPGGLLGKSLEIFKQAVPRATRIAVLINPANAVASALVSAEAPTATRQLGVQLQMLEVRIPEEIEQAINSAVQEKADALWVIGDPIFHFPAQRIPDLAARARLPAMYLPRDLVTAGGLMSYGPDIIEMHRRAATYIDKILKGTKPAELPVEQPTRYELVINLKTAKALGLTIPHSLLIRADEVIQ